MTGPTRRAWWAVGGAGFVALAVGYERKRLASLDADVSKWVASNMPTAAEWLARPPSWVGGWIGLTVIGIALSVVLVHERAWVDLGFLLATFAGSQIVVGVLKDSFDRPRPDAGSAVDLPSSDAFPSGHAAAGAASFGAAAILVSERVASRRARAWVWAVALVASVAVGVSRVALNVHYVTDVLAGWCFGLAWLAACLLVRDALKDRLR